MSIERMISARQIKAARALLDWSQEDLADATSLSVATIRKLEMGKVSPRGTTNDVICRAFENANLEFLQPNGVRQRPQDIQVFEGADQLKYFYEDIYQTTKKAGKDILSVATDPNAYFRVMGNDANANLKKMGELKGTVGIRCLITEVPNPLPAPEFTEYRLLSKSYVDSIPFYVYGNKCAIRTIDPRSPPKVVVIESALAADAFRRQFESMWDKATLLSTPK